MYVNNKNNGYLINLGEITSLRVKGSDKELCKVEIVDQTYEFSNVRLQVQTYWKRRDGEKSFMRLFPNGLYIINDYVFKVIYSTAKVEEGEPFNTVLELLESVNDIGCNRTFYDDRCIVGCGKYNPIDHYNIYNEWKYIIDMVYGEIRGSKYSYTLHPEWNSFQSFASWYEENCPEGGKSKRFGKYILVKDIGNTGTIEIGPSNTVFVEKSIMQFPRVYKYVISNDDIYSAAPSRTQVANNKGKFVSYIYSYELGKLVLLGEYNTMEEARENYLTHIMNRRTEILKYLKDKKSMILEPLIETIQKL